MVKAGPIDYPQHLNRTISQPQYNGQLLERRGRLTERVRGMSGGIVRGWGKLCEPVKERLRFCFSTEQRVTTSWPGHELLPVWCCCLRCCWYGVAVGAADGADDNNDYHHYYDENKDDMLVTTVMAMIIIYDHHNEDQHQSFIDEKISWILLKSWRIKNERLELAQTLYSHICHDVMDRKIRWQLWWWLLLKVIVFFTVA